MLITYQGNIILFARQSNMEGDNFAAGSLLQQRVCDRHSELQVQVGSSAHLTREVMEDGAK